MPLKKVHAPLTRIPGSAPDIWHFYIKNFWIFSIVDFISHFARLFFLLGYNLHSKPKDILFYKKNYTLSVRLKLLQSMV